MTPTPDIDQFLPAGPELDRRRAALVRHLRSTQSATSHAVRIPRGVAASLGALAIAGGGVAGAAVLLEGKDVAVAAGIGCYAKADRSADTTVILPAGDPVAECGRLWRQGVIDGTPHATAPPLVACTAQRQPVLVFPGTESTCTELDLEPLPADYAGAAARGRAVLEAVGSLGGSACLTVADLRVQAREALNTHGLSDIPIEDGNLTGGTCAHVVVDGLTVKIYTHEAG